LEKQKFVASYLTKKQVFTSG